MEDEETPLATAARHLAEARCIVAEQRDRVARLKAAGHPTGGHVTLLRAFEDTLANLERHERALRQAEIDGEQA